ncbi:Preprotein translocase subunit SECE1 [Carex littledalei]|uniref:Preprotein translocase subunit SECE1 n=1 Tax=Carex littledalei TaxID=544730 RepID=A0A833VX17_9POAL|nr:Preprotein translocase subunit SECE1 [Carex littledalei]
MLDSSPGFVAPKSKKLRPQCLHLLSATLSFNSSIRPLFSTNRIRHCRLCAQEKSSDSSTTTSVKILLDDQSELQTQAQAQSKEKKADSSTDAASELKQMLRERKEREQQGDNLLTGVAQEVRGFEWLNLGKMVGTTGIVLAIIAGSTAALLSVNGILVELSDRLFDGRIKIQDFF